MKRKEIEQLMNGTVPELETKVKEAREKMRNLISEKELGKLKNPHEITALRKNIARMLTFLKIKQTSN